MRKFIINEEQEKELIKRLNEEVYQMPVDKKANKPYCINPEKVLIVKKFLDKTFTPHDYEKIGSNGLPIKIKVVSMNASNGEPLKYMYKDQLHDLLIDRFQNMFMDVNERSLFMKQVMEDWLNGSIGIFGNLSRNYLSENTIDERANEAELNPTDAQKEAGNYKMGHVRIMGMPISIENPKGSYRTYKTDNGGEGKIQMKSHYGYFTNTTGNGKDGDAVDVFIGPNAEECEYIYVVDQNDQDGNFDESKVMLGFNSIEHAKNGYMENYTSDWKGFRGITKVTIDVFKRWLYRKHKQRKPFADYAYIKKKMLNEGIINEEEYNQVCKIARMFDEKAAYEVAEEINAKGVYAYNEDNIVYAVIEQDPNNVKYVDDTIEKCKVLAYEYAETHSDFRQFGAVRESLQQNQVKETQFLTLESNDYGNNWKAYNKDGDYIGGVEGDIYNLSEGKIIERIK